MKYIFLMIFNLFTLIIFAQKHTNTLKVHGGPELTTGLFADGYKTGWGVYATDYVGLGDKTSLSLSTGVAFWNAKNASIKAGMSLTRLGLRQFVSNGLYFQGDAGLGIGLSDWSNDKEFVFGGGTGYLFKTKKGGGFDLSLRANRGFSRTWIGLGLGYEFKL